MRSDFAAFILTHGRPDNVITYDAIRKHGYTGKVYLVVDDEDKTLPQYIERYGAQVLVFSKQDIAERFDEGDNFADRRAIFYARNACFDLAEQVGVRYFIQLDDDYSAFWFKFDRERRYRSSTLSLPCLDEVWSAMLEYFISIPAHSIAMSQGGDHLGGPKSSYNKTSIIARRKAMNTFICDTQRRFAFVGRINEDVNTYTTQALRGGLFLTIMHVEMMQRATQTAAGGMTDIYLAGGTYVKSFYTVMYAPSCTKIAELGYSNIRIHHKINWKHAAAKI